MQQVAVPILNGEPWTSRVFIGLDLEGVEAREVPSDSAMNPERRTLLWL